MSQHGTLLCLLAVLWHADIALIQTNENIPPHTLASTLFLPQFVIDWATVTKNNARHSFLNDIRISEKLCPSDRQKSNRLKRKVMILAIPKLSNHCNL